MKFVSSEHIIHEFSRFSEPCLEVDPGDQVTFQVLDASNNRYRTVEDALTLRTPREQANPATGPVFVRGTKPGDSLVVVIQEIHVGPIGYNRILPGRGVIFDELHPPRANIVTVRAGTVHFDERIQFPARPMIGVIGTAPAGEPMPTLYPGPHGGNLDVNEIRVGAQVYLPVAVPGALLSIGDVHASMGDGELTGGGIDISAEVAVRVNVLKGRTWPRPWIETPDAWVTYGHGCTLEQAVRLATSDMTTLLADKLSISREEAFQLIGARGDAHLGQAAQMDFAMTAYIVMPKIVPISV